MSVASLIADGRRLAEELMIDEGVISRRSGSAPTLDQATGILAPSAATTIYSGPCRVKAPTAQEQVAIFGEEATTSQRFVISLPWDVPEVLIGDVITVTSSGDPHIGSRRFRVVSVESKSVLHSRRLGAETVE